MEWQEDKDIALLISTAARRNSKGQTAKVLPDDVLVGKANAAPDAALPHAFYASRAT